MNRTVRLVIWLCLFILTDSAATLAASPERGLLPFSSFVTEKAERGYSRVRHPMAATYNAARAIGVQAEVYAARLRRLGCRLGSESQFNLFVI